jgi:hypothetical protein
MPRSTGHSDCLFAAPAKAPVVPPPPEAVDITNLCHLISVVARGGDLKKGAITYVKGHRPLSGGSWTQSGPDASAQFVGRVARLSGNVRQPNHVLAN